MIEHRVTESQSFYFKHKGTKTQCFFRERKIQRAAKAALQRPQSFLPQGVFLNTETLRHWDFLRVRKIQRAAKAAFNKVHKAIHPRGFVATLVACCLCIQKNLCVFVSLCSNIYKLLYNNSYFTFRSWQGQMVNWVVTQNLEYIKIT